MSVRLMAKVWELELPANEKLLLLTLADFAADDGEQIYPSVATMCRKSSMPERTVRRLLGRLRERGVLELVEPARQHKPARYRLRPATLAPLRPATVAALEEVPDLPNVHARPATVAPKPSVEPPETFETFANAQVSPPANELERPTAQTHLAWFIDESRERGSDPPPRFVGQLAKELATNVNGHGSEIVRAALTIILDRRLNPSTFASCLQQASLERNDAGHGPKRYGRGLTAAAAKAQTFEAAREGR